MDTYKFARLPSNSSVAAAVTFAVSAWFLVAGGILVAESPGRGPQAAPAAVADAAGGAATPAAPAKRA